MINELKHTEETKRKLSEIEKNNLADSILWDKIHNYTMTAADRVRGLINSVKYVVANHIDGDFVECGVWRGGSMMSVALTLNNIGEQTRHLHLFDTFEGMTMPTQNDVGYDGKFAESSLNNAPKTKDSLLWAIASYEDVKQNMASTGYPNDNIHLIKGKVEDTIPLCAPDKIAILRLDTDWYESTKHELKYLYPRLVPNGVLIIDDYGHWLGARQAVDEYFDTQEFKPLLNRLDYTGCLIIKSKI